MMSLVSRLKNTRAMRLAAAGLIFAAACLLQAQDKPAPPAPVTALVFSDFSCPFSSDLYFTLGKLQARYPGRLQVIVKANPLPIHPQAPLAHRAALAAGRQGRFDAMSALLYANQTRQDDAALLSYARELHLDLPRFRRDLDSPEIARELTADESEGHALDIRQTPTMFIDGQRLTGTQTEQTLAALLDKEAARQLGAGAVSPASNAPAIDPALFAEMLRNPSATQGPANAPLTIVEFTDFQCPFCRSAVVPMEQLMAAHGREVHWIFRSFPLDFHLDSELADEAALAAGEQGKFWEMHDLLFAHQTAIKPADLRRYAEQLQLNLADFDKDLATHRFAGRIAADRALGNRAGISGTPTFVIDGQMLTGVRSLPELNQLLAAHEANPGAHPAGAPGGGTQLAGITETPLASLRQILGPAADPKAGPAPGLSLTWFTDVRSPLAARQAELIRTLSSRYPSLRVYFRALPLGGRPDGRIASAALIVAEQAGKFWPMYDALADRRDTLDRDKLEAIAGGLGFDRVAFGEALAKADTAADLEEAARRGITGSPVIFVNAERIDGLQREASYTEAIDRELKAAPPVQASSAGPLRPAGASATP